jgi:Glycosyl transferase family 90
VYISGEEDPGHSDQFQDDEELGRDYSRRVEKRRRPRKSSKPGHPRNSWSQRLVDSVVETSYLFGMRTDDRTNEKRSSRRKESSRRKRKPSKSQWRWQSLVSMALCAFALVYVVDVPGLLFYKNSAAEPEVSHVASNTGETSLNSAAWEKAPAQHTRGSQVQADQKAMSPDDMPTIVEENGEDSLQVPSEAKSSSTAVSDETSDEDRSKHQASPPREAPHEAAGQIKSPLNNQMTELQVPADTGRLDEATVKSYYRKLATAYLATFTHGIFRHMFFDVLRRRTYSLTPPGANKGVQSMMFQIIDKKVYMMDPYEVPKNSKPFYRTRINEIIWLLSKLATAGRIKNTEFMVSIHDCVQTVNHPHDYRGATYRESIPSFTIVACNFSDNIPFPMWEGDEKRGGGFAGWDERMQEYATASQLPWEQKESRAVFRGGNRPSMFFRNKTTADEHCNEVGRTRLAYLASEHSQQLDASVGGSCGGVHHYLQRMDELKQQKFKYVVYAEGNCFWADRLNKQVFGPSLIFKQETPCGQFWEPLLKPMAHYVPADFFFNNLIDQINWARENDAKVQEIVRNANDFANNFLTLQGISSYVEVLLSEYTALLVEPDVKVEPGAIDVTNKRV